MEYPDNLWTKDADAEWTTDGPNSEGIKGWMLWRDHMFFYEHTGFSSSVERGVPVSTFLERYRDSGDVRYRQILDDLAARGYR